MANPYQNLKVKYVIACIYLLLLFLDLANIQTWILQICNCDDSIFQCPTCRLIRINLTGTFIATLRPPYVMSKTEGQGGVLEKLKIIPAKFQSNRTSFVLVMGVGDTFESVMCTAANLVVHGVVVLGGKHELLRVRANEYCQVKINEVDT